MSAPAPWRWAETFGKSGIRARPTVWGIAIERARMAGAWQPASFS